jgi:hypothetical protein
MSLTPPFIRMDMVERTVRGTVFVGKFLGMVQDLDGTWIGIARTSAEVVFAGPVTSFRKHNPNRTLEGVVIIQTHQ